LRSRTKTRRIPATTIAREATAIAAATAAIVAIRAIPVITRRVATNSLKLFTR